MKVLIGCEYSGIVREEFRKLGHDAWSNDILPTEIQGQHYQGDVFDAIRIIKPDLFIGHPPCTRLCNSGVLRRPPALQGRQEGKWNRPGEMAGNGGWSYVL